MGQTTLDNVIRERNRLLEAELEIAKTSIDRIRIREERVKNFRDLENEIKQRHKAGQVTNDKILVAKAARLQAEIELLRE
jgi:outer membrane protein TolC